MPRRRFITVALLGACALARPLALAQCETARLHASLPLAGSAFGAAVAIKGDLLIVGAPEEAQPGLPGAGAAYVFRLVGGAWAEEARLIAADAATGDRFGRSVAIAGDVAVVGAPLEDDTFAGPDAGAAYIFRKAQGGAWAQEAKIRSFSSATGDEFGAGVAYDGVFALVGAPNHTENGPSSGTAYVFSPFSPTQWIEEAQLLAPDGATGDLYGASVSINAQRFIIGAPGATHWGQGSGAAYFGRRLAAGLIAYDGKATPDDGAPSDSFGASVAIRGLVALIGAPGTDASALTPNTGAAYTFRRIGAGAFPWVQEQRINPSAAGAGDRHGASVALEANALLITSGLAGASDAGAAQVFVRRPSGLWQAWSRLPLEATSPGDGYGAAVALDGATGVVGGPSLDWALVDAGAAAVHEIGRRDGDTDGDGAVDFIDLNQVLSDYGAMGMLLGDVNLDGLVDFVDLNSVLSAFGSDCPE